MGFDVVDRILKFDHDDESNQEQSKTAAVAAASFRHDDERGF
jgi:hypothetical protein